MKWLEKNATRKYTNSTADISVTVTKNGSYFTFRNNCTAKVTKGDYIKIGMTADRMYFDDGDISTGYKLFGREQGKQNKHVHLRRILKRFEGEYELSWDSKEGLYYIGK